MTSETSSRTRRASMPGGHLEAPDSLQAMALQVVEGKEALAGPDYSAFLETLDDAPLGTVDSVETGDLSSAGWGVVFSASTSPAVVEALAPLLEHRRAAAARYDEMGFRSFVGDDGYQPGESVDDFLRRAGARPDGPVIPEALPYYLLLVGDPEEIPLSFQYELDVEYAVGRIWFETPEEYRRYALAVVAAESEENPPARHAVLFAPSHGEEPHVDGPTQLSIENLTKPLATTLEAEYGGAEKGGWTFETVVGEEATKTRLAEVVERRDAPALLFTAGHGAAFENGHPRQREDQGAVVCREWPGEAAWGDSLIPEFYFAADDLTAATNLRGSIVFQFACFSAGTPRKDDFRVIHNDYLSVGSPFLARLPQRLLAPAGGGGALAFIGHIDRVWAHSFLSGGPSEHDRVIYEETLGRLLDGHPVGHAMEFFNLCYARNAVRLTTWHDRIRFDDEMDLADFARAWLIHNDARNFILIGDPAVRLKVEKG